MLIIIFRKRILTCSVFQKKDGNGTFKIEHPVYVTEDS